MILFTQKEKKFLESMEECRLATSHNDIPHVKPVSYLFLDSQFLIATDYGTRTLNNLLQNPKASLVVDVYKPGKHQAVVIQGKVSIIEEGDEFIQTYKKFFQKFQWVRDEPWKEKEAPFLNIKPFRKSSWGIN